jgi:hypothetical protein
MRVLRASAHTITSPTFVGADEESPADCASTPVCAVAREDGTSLTAATVTHSDVGVYTAALTTTHTASLDRLKLTWTGTAGSQVQVYVQEVEVVGAHYAGIPEIRGRRDLDNTVRFPLEEIRRVRDAWADRIEEAMRVAFVPRYARDVLDGDGTNRLALNHVLPHTLVSVTINGTAQSLTGYTLDPSGAIRSTSTFPCGDPANIEVVYEHGYLACPPDVRLEYVKAVRAELLRDKTSLPSDAISTTVDGVTVRLGTPNPELGRPTGILALDAVLMGSHDYRTPAVA